MKKAATTAGSGQQIRAALTLPADDVERLPLIDWLSKSECWATLVRSGACRPHRVAKAARELNLPVMWSLKRRAYRYSWDQLLQIAEYLSQEVR